MPRLRSVALLCTLAITACDDPAGVSVPGRARLVALDAPATHAVGTPLTVSLTYELGGCDRFTGVQGRVVGAVLEVEVRNVFEPEPFGGCIDIGPLQRVASVEFATPPLGTVTVRGLQPEPTPPLERQVTITP